MVSGPGREPHSRCECPQYPGMWLLLGGRNPHGPHTRWRGSRVGCQQRAPPNAGCSEPPPMGRGVPYGLGAETAGRKNVAAAVSAKSALPVSAMTAINATMDLRLGIVCSCRAVSAAVG